jgi:hypothetical protein
MSPVIKHGWKIKIMPTDEDKVRIGDIVAFGNSVIVCHRIVAKLRFLGKIYFIQKGDNSIVGGIFDSKSLIGRVEEVIDSQGKATDREIWRTTSVQKTSFYHWIYLFLYFFKKKFLKINCQLSNNFNVFLWRHVVRKK